MIAIITALPEELAPLLRRAKIERVVRLGRNACHVGMLQGTSVVMMAGGDGLQRAQESLQKLLEYFEVSLVIGAGIAGSLVDDLGSGDLVVASEIRGASVRCHLLAARPAVIFTADRMIATAAAKRELAATGAQVVDMESFGWARAASKRDVPLAIVRVILDSVDEEIPAFVASEGPIDRGAVMRHAILHPNTIPTLLQMRERLRACSETLAVFIARSVASMEARLHELLVETSRTFALCIPLLRDETCHQVTIAYLLFRIADTFEDASHWTVADRLSALDAFCALLRRPDADEARRLAATWCAKGPSAHAGYKKLIAEVPLVIETFARLAPEVKAVIRDHAIRSAQGMAKFVAMTENGKLQLADMQQLREYCYAVAGIVGEMLTEIFLLRAPQLRESAPFLRARAAKFGEGLQLVNILKDSASDASEGRCYIPAGVDRADVVALARADLESASEYILACQNNGAPQGIVAFTALPVALAQATLDRLEKSSAGAKIGRPEVFRITRQVKRSVARGEPPLRRRSQNLSGFARMRSMFSTMR